MDEEPTVASPACEKIKPGKAAQYDAAAKALISTPEFMHAIISTLIPDAKGMTLEDFKRSCHMQKPNHLGLAMLPTENAVEGEGKISYDVLCSLLDEEGIVMSFIDIEAQKKPSTGYSLPVRGMYYRARMLSSQFQSEGDEHMIETYRNLKKVYSIWLCFNCPAKYAGRIIEYKTEPRAVFGEVNAERDYMDLGSLIMVYLPKVYKATDNADDSKEASLIDLLSAVFNESLDLEAKRAKMKERGIAMSKKVEGGVIEMCNLGEGIAEQAAEQARAETRESDSKEFAKMLFTKYHESIEEVAKAFPDLSLETLKRLKAECDKEFK